MDKKSDTSVKNKVYGRKKYVYFIFDEHGCVKIGKSINTEDRRSNIQVSNSSDLVLYKRVECELEKPLKNLFNKYKKRGEWFYVTPILQGFITAVNEDNIKEVMKETIEKVKEDDFIPPTSTNGKYYENDIYVDLMKKINKKDEKIKNMIKNSGQLAEKDEEPPKQRLTETEARNLINEITDICSISQSVINLPETTDIEQSSNFYIEEIFRALTEFNLITN